MKYLFRGYVSDVSDLLCWMRMSDLTEPTNPDEQWAVALARLPKVPHVGERVTFEISRRRGVFKFDKPRTWTQGDLDRVKANAAAWARLFGVESATSVGAVDPQGGVEADGPRAEESSDVRHGQAPRV